MAGVGAFIGTPRPVLHLSTTCVSSGDPIASFDGLLSSSELHAQEEEAIGTRGPDTPAAKPPAPSVPGCSQHLRAVHHAEESAASDAGRPRDLRRQFVAVRLVERECEGFFADGEAHAVPSLELAGDIVLLTEIGWRLPHVDHAELDRARASSGHVHEIFVVPAFEVKTAMVHEAVRDIVPAIAGGPEVLHGVPASVLDLDDEPGDDVPDVRVGHDGLLRKMRGKPGRTGFELTERTFNNNIRKVFCQSTRPYFR